MCNKKTSEFFFYTVVDHLFSFLFMSSTNPKARVSHDS